MNTETVDKLDQYKKVAEAAKEVKVNWWSPEKTEEAITGEVEFVGEMESSYGLQQIIRIKDGDTIYSKVQTGAIKKEILTQQIRRGDIISLKYFGTQDLENGKSYKNFQIILHERGPQDDIPF